MAANGQGRLRLEAGPGKLGRTYTVDLARILGFGLGLGEDEVWEATERVLGPWFEFLEEVPVGRRTSRVE